MPDSSKIFYKKKILIYGLGKSGHSAFKYLKKDNQITTYEDKIKDDSKEITKIKFDYIIISTTKYLDLKEQWVASVPAVRNKKVIWLELRQITKIFSRCTISIRMFLGKVHLGLCIKVRISRTQIYR